MNKAMPGGRLAILLIPMILLGACVSGQERSTRLLNQRMQDRLATEVAAGSAAVQRLPEGVRVTLLGSSLFPNGARALDDQSTDIRADVIQGLLDPTLMRVQVTDSSTLPAYQRDTRVRNVEEYFVANGLGPVLAPGDATPAEAGPAGLVLTIGVQCPRRDRYIGYGDGRSRPVCD